MSPLETVTLMLVLLAGLLTLRVPVAFALALASIPPILLDERLSLFLVLNQMFASFNSFILLAVPFFLLAANLMNAGGITERLLRLSRALVGSLPGATAQVNVVLSVFFAGISGSAAADAASQAKIFIPSMVKEGYDRSFAVTNTAVSSILAQIIPPSILMVIWGGTMSVSIGALFIGGVLPGLLLSAAMMLTVHVYAKLRDYPRYARTTMGELGLAALVSLPALFTPVIILGGKIFGWFTATESAAIAVVYTVFLAFLVHRELDLRAFFKTLVETGRLTSTTLFCVGTASIFGWLLAYYKIPAALVGIASAWGMGGVGAGFFIAGVFLVVGCFLDAVPAIIILGSVLQPVAESAGLDPIHFALIGIVSLAFGLVTPPYGLCLLISAAVGEVRLRDTFRDVAIQLAPLFVVLATLIMFPRVYLYLPSLLGPEGAR